MGGGGWWSWWSGWSIKWIRWRGPERLVVVPEKKGRCRGSWSWDERFHQLSGNIAEGSRGNTGSSQLSAGSCPGGSCLKPQTVVKQQDVGCAGSEVERGAVAAREQTVGGQWGEGLVLSFPHTLLAGERNQEPRQAALSQLRPAGSLLSLSAIRHIPATSGLFFHDIWLLRRAALCMLFSLSLRLVSRQLSTDGSPFLSRPWWFCPSPMANRQAGWGWGWGENQGRI